MRLLFEPKRSCTCKNLILLVLIWKAGQGGSVAHTMELRLPHAPASTVCVQENSTGGVVPHHCCGSG